ncbi:MAG: DUF5011 domain-containing protein, partial [Opitutae bacterium]|nr:DUF5011 domain-containing protein [Opitutae bacterium]
TDDNLLRLDHVMTKPDGTFTLNKLPRGNWIVFALPPFESKSYRGYQESEEIELSLNDGDEESDQTLTLTASNVSGRVMFSKKTTTGGRETVPLGHGFIWAFTDEDGDGNPDSSEEDLDEFVEEFVELNKDGYFTLNLDTTGAYTLYVEIPPEHRANDPGAISFSVTNPDELIKVGNAVEISWSTKLSATGFGIERKASTSTSYKSLLSSDLSSSTRSYIDTSITPGETYAYRVTATLSSGNVTLEDTDVSQTDPFVYLAPSSKIITGTVVDGDGNTISGAEIFAASKQGFIETTTDDTGAYELTAGPGTWKVNLRPARGVQATWIYEGFPEEIEFMEDATSESTSVNFEVTVLGNGKITGTILKADGSSDWTGLTDYVEVNAFSPSGEGNATAIGADGTFEILLPAGGYDVSVWINHEQFPTYKPPAAQHVRVANATVDLGNITLGAKSSKISGSLTDADGNALPNFSVSARSKKTGAFISDTTNAAGQYELNVDSGAWEVMFELPIAESGAEIPYLMQKSKRVKVGASQTKSLDFTVAKAASSIGGTVVDSSGNPITDLDLFVYVRNAAADAGLHAIVNEAEVDSRGKFTLSLSDGEYATGVWVPQGSGFRPDAEATFTISGGEVSHAEGVTALSLTLLSNDAVISGTLNLNETAVSGIKGDVFAVSSEGWEETSIQSDGTYSLTLGPGDWNIGYQIVSDSDTSRIILPSPASPTRTTAVAGSTVTQDFSLKTAGATITGTILDENGTQLADSTVYIWATRIGDPTYDDYETEVESTDGTFSLSVEAGGAYQVGAYLPPELRESGYLEPRAQPADISATGAATVSLTLEKPAEENFIEGNIATGESTIEGAYVYAWSDDGQFAEGETDVDGNYKLLVPSGSTWHVGADFVNVDDEGTETIYITDNELSVDLSVAASSSARNIILAQPDFEVPDGAADTFDATKDFTTVLEDGTEIYIPANAVPVEVDANGNSEVRFVVSPYTEGLVKNANDQPLDYGYQIELYDSSGKEISQEFNKAVTMTMAFDATELAAEGINSENLNISFFNSTKNAWENSDAVSIDAEAGKIFASVTHFSNWANTATPDTTAPVITLIGDASVTISAGDSYTDAGATASDDTDGDISANITPDGAVIANTPGTYTLSYDVSDAAGNAATQVTRTVIVQDTTAPIITLNGEATITFTVGGTYSEPGASASDNVDGDISANIEIGGDTVNPNTAGTYTIAFNVSDAAGNAATQVNRSVVVEAATGEADTIVPVITLVGDNPLVLEVNSNYTNPGATATDNIDGVITDSITVGGDTVNSSVTGTYSITYNVSDAAGNAAVQVTRTVTVQDTIAPVITVIGDATVTITVGDVYTDAGATATDGNDGDISANITVGGDRIDINAAGTYDITYNVSDAAGNAASTAHRSLVVQEPTPVDTTAPVITVTGDATVTITVGDVYTDAGATASDDTDGDISVNISISGDTVDVNTAGTYNITYDVYDAAGNAATTAYRVVIIREAVPSAETIPPVLTLAGDATVIISVGDSYIDAGATAIDEADGDISANITLSGDTVDVNTAGSYTLTYNVSDAAGNAATTISRMVVVQPVYASGEGESGAGAVIFMNIEGDVRVQNLQSSNYLETDAVAVGKSISAGHAVEVEDQAKVTLLFSNGSVTTLTGKSKLSILEFSQTAFAGGTETLGSMEEEPSSSTTQLELLYGDLVFDVLKLNEISSYVLNSPVGKTVIKGTIGQLNVTTNADGTVNGGINMVEGLVSYTDPSGNSADVPASQGTVVQVSAAGSQIGTTQNIAVSTAASAAITNTATASATAAAGVSLNQLATQALATMQSSLTVFVNVPVISRQTGLMNQVLRVENKTSATIDAFKLTFSNLKDVKNVYNRTGTDAEGNNYVEIPQTLNSGDAIDVAVSYYPTVHSVSEIPATITVAEIDINTIWDGAANVGDGWLQLDWFDLFNADQFPWIFHPAMGWIYMLGNDSDNLWMWHPELGWHWTSKSVYPQIYLANDTAWAFLSTANATTQIYNYQTGEWGVLAP